MYFGGKAIGPGEVVGALRDEHPVGVRPATVQLVDRGPCVQRQRQVAVRVGRCGGGGHHPRREGLHDGPEAPEVGGDVLDRPARVAQEALRRAEEAAPEGHVGLGEHRVQVGEQGAEDPEVLPVVAFAEGVEERRGVPGAQSHGEGVGRAHLGGGRFGGLDDLGHYCSLRLTGPGVGRCPAKRSGPQHDDRIGGHGESRQRLGRRRRRARRGAGAAARRGGDELGRPRAARRGSRRAPRAPSAWGPMPRSPSTSTTALRMLRRPSGRSRALRSGQRQLPVPGTRARLPAGQLRRRGRGGVRRADRPARPCPRSPVRASARSCA